MEQYTGFFITLLLIFIFAVFSKYIFRWVKSVIVACCIVVSYYFITVINRIDKELIQVGLTQSRNLKECPIHIWDILFIFHKFVYYPIRQSIYSNSLQIRVQKVFCGISRSPKC